MAHNLNSMMYVGETPWHGLGTKLEHAATAAEAIQAAGLGWSVTKTPLYKSVTGGFVQVPGAYGTRRDDTGDILGVVGEIYRPLQNREAFSFFDAVVGSKEAIYHTAGSLGKGERTWILAKLPGEIRVIGDDVSEKFLLLTNTHDGTGAVSIMFSPIRVVCQNTLNIAMRSGSQKQSLRHTGTLGLRVGDVREGLGLVVKRFGDFEATARAMAGTQVNGEAWRKMLKDIGIMPADEAKASARADGIIEEVSALFEGGQKGGRMPGVYGTAWGAFNAVAEYVDFHRSTRVIGNGDKSQARAASLLFGSGADLKQKAWDATVKMTATA